MSLSLRPAGIDASWQAHARYGALGLPLAFVALPLYVILPAHYTQALGMPLAVVGLVLLAVRLLDAVIDPWLGRWADRRLDHPSGAWPAMAIAGLALAAGMWAVFFPPAGTLVARLAWCVAALLITCLAFSAASITHQAWGCRLGGNAVQRARWVAWREGPGLAGVLLANVVAVTWGPAAMAATLSATMLLGLGALRRAPRPPWSSSAPLASLAGAARNAPARAGLWIEPWRHGAFRHLSLLYLVNGVAAAIPATLVMFFIQDVVQRPDLAALFLGLYFATGAASVPIWVRLVARWGPSRAWAVGMAGHVLAFGGVMLVGPGDAAAYAAVCLASGLMLGADLTVPGTLLTGVLQRLGEAGGPGLSRAGLFTGWWQLLTKLNLALAAGLALPLLAWLGYDPADAASHRSPQAMDALRWVYGAVPCAFKLLALGLWWRLWARQGQE
ncbi:MAG: MFS transporter [Rubrivivax sp.]|nr:MAG: MFS transporter [Rubrivivax sp.]